MLEFYLRSMLGALGSPALDFMRHHPTVVAGVLLVWLGLFAAGRWQLWRIQQESVRLVLTMAEDLKTVQPPLSARELYERIYVRWTEMIGQWAWFVPHRLDLWPVPVTVKTVQQKFPLSPAWVAEVLRQQAIKLDQEHGSQLKTT